MERRWFDQLNTDLTAGYSTLHKLKIIQDVINSSMDKIWCKGGSCIVSVGLVPLKCLLLVESYFTSGNNIEIMFIGKDFHLNSL